jgi:uncharacterized protein (DUF2236 family)
MGTGPIDAVIDEVRQALGSAIFERIAGPDGVESRKRLRDIDSERQFPLGSPITRVQGDASMLVGGLSALLLQSLHPLAVAGVDQHSGYRGDPWGRLARTSHFLAVTTFGSSQDAQHAIETVKRVHRRVRGTAPDGRSYAASDPHLLRWVHVAEVHSFLGAHQRYGVKPLTSAEQDEYVRQASGVAIALGARDVPGTRAELDAALDAFRPELQSTPTARAAARYLVVNPPVPFALRGAYFLLASAAVGLLPRWARWPLRLPWLPLTEATAVRAAGELATRSVRWALTPPS